MLLAFAPISTRAQTLPAQGAELSNAEVQGIARQIFQVGTLQRNGLMAHLVDHGDTDVVPTLIQSLRFLGQDPWTIVNALQSLTGEDHGTR